MSPEFIPAKQHERPAQTQPHQKGNDPAVLSRRGIEGEALSDLRAGDHLGDEAPDFFPVLAVDLRAGAKQHDDHAADVEMGDLGPRVDPRGVFFQIELHGIEGLPVLVKMRDVVADPIALRIGSDTVVVKSIYRKTT